MTGVSKGVPDGMSRPVVLGATLDEGDSLEVDDRT